jgi:hypothetical protein
LSKVTNQEKSRWTPQDTKEGFWVKVNLQGENMNVGLKEAFTVKVYL